MRHQDKVTVISAVFNLDAQHFHLYAAWIADTQCWVAMMEAVTLGIVQSVPMVVIS